MTKKRFWITLIIAFAVAIWLIALWGISLAFYNPFLAPKMVAFYSNDSNYCTYEAVVKDLPEETTGYLSIESISRTENGEQIKNINQIKARVFSSDIDETWSRFAPEKGLKFKFVGTLKVFFDGCPAAIVSLTVEEKQILSFEEGKAALLDWAKRVY